MHDIKLTIEPCPDCPIPPNFITKPGVKNGQKCIYIDCRECGDKWTELLDNE